MTVTDALLAFPIAFYMAQGVAPRVTGALVAVLMPLWSFYLVRSMPGRRCSAVTASSTGPSTRSGFTVRFGATAVWLVESYLWLPYMILPIYDAWSAFRLAARGVRGPRRQPSHVPARDPSDGLPSRRRRLDLHLLAHPGRLHHAVAGLAGPPS